MNMFLTGQTFLSLRKEQSMLLFPLLSLSTPLPSTPLVSGLVVSEMKTCFLEKHISCLPVSFRLQHMCVYIYIYIYPCHSLAVLLCVLLLAPLSAWVSPEGRLYYLLDKTAGTFTKRAVGQWRPAVQSPCAQFMDSIFMCSWAFLQWIALPENGDALKRISTCLSCADSQCQWECWLANL